MKPLGSTFCSLLSYYHIFPLMFHFCSFLSEGTMWWSLLNRNELYLHVINRWQLWGGAFIFSSVGDIFHFIILKRPIIRHGLLSPLINFFSSFNCSVINLMHNSDNCEKSYIEYFIKPQESFNIIFLNYAKALWNMVQSNFKPWRGIPSGMLSTLNFFPIDVSVNFHMCPPWGS